MLVVLSLLSLALGAPVEMVEIEAGLTASQIHSCLLNLTHFYQSLQAQRQANMSSDEDFDNSTNRSASDMESLDLEDCGEKLATRAKRESEGGILISDLVLVEDAENFTIVCYVEPLACCFDTELNMESTVPLARHKREHIGYTAHNPKHIQPHFHPVKNILGRTVCFRLIFVLQQTYGRTVSSGSYWSRCSADAGRFSIYNLPQVKAQLEKNLNSTEEETKVKRSVNSDEVPEAPEDQKLKTKETFSPFSFEERMTCACAGMFCAMRSDEPVIKESFVASSPYEEVRSDVLTSCLCCRMLREEEGFKCRRMESLDDLCFHHLVCV